MHTISWFRPTGAFGIACVFVVALASGCTRTHYRVQTDREAGYLLREKSVNTPWEVDPRFTVSPDPRSRFFDPTDPDCPTLPPAGPSLYSYPLPFLPREAVVAPEPLSPAAEGPSSDSEIPTPEVGADAAGAAAGIRLVAFHQDTGQVGDAAEVSRFSPAEDPFADPIRLTMEVSATHLEGGIIPAIESSFWDSLPTSCTARILEFASIRDEYEQTFKSQPSQDLMNNAPRLTLRDLFELALLNSRAYQQQKENLYRAALNLSLERFDYATKFTTTGNGVDTTYTHSRNNGRTVNTLSIPSSLQGNKMLAAGGTLLGQFANDILLTYNGPDGFSADVSSELLFNVTQSVFQRDVLLNSLIQSERDLVYAARSFTRYRRQFFLDLATSYYSLLRTYRGVEIDAQNYFSQVRNFQQAETEVQSGITRAPDLVGVNQFEQGVLTARSAVIRACNDIEEGLDSLKLEVGLPTETPLNIDLTELQQLTLRDSIEVERERSERWRRSLESLLAQAGPDTLGEILNADASLAERLYSWTVMRKQLAATPVDENRLAEMRAEFRLATARIDAQSKQTELDGVLNQETPAPRTLILLRQVELIQSQQVLVERQGQLALRRHLRPSLLDPLREQLRQLENKRKSFQTRIDKGLESPRELRIQDLLGEASMLVAEYGTMAQNLDQVLFGRQVDTVDLTETLAQTNNLVQLSRDLFRDAQSGLPVIDLSADEAMLTALTQRLDLMNTRGGLADSWREIKLAADELKSFLNLNASQVFRNEKNRPFDFSFRNSQTRVGLSLDLPFNRKAQRNAYRRALISYNATWRELMNTEDNIKFRVRSELRNLEQARVQYPISVAQAALASEQVFSTQMQLMLGTQGVRALDLLAAFSDSREALGRVADARIGYIILRAQFAFALEAMMLDDTGYWPEVNNEQYQIKANTVYPWNGGSAYGTFPSYLKVSHELRRMLNYPPPGAEIHSAPPGSSPVDPEPEQTP